MMKLFGLKVRCKLKHGWVASLIVLALVTIYYNQPSDAQEVQTSSLDVLSRRTALMYQGLPGHFMLSSTTVRIHHDASMGCWMVLGYVLPEVELYYSGDDQMLQRKNITLDTFLSWVKKHKFLDIWVWDSKMHLQDGGRAYRIIELEDETEDKKELYLHVKGESCLNHEGSRVSMYGSMSPEDMHALLLDDQLDTDHKPE